MTRAGRAALAALVFLGCRTDSGASFASAPASSYEPSSPTDASSATSAPVAGAAANVAVSRPRPSWSANDPVRVRLGGFERSNAIELVFGERDVARLRRVGRTVALGAGASQPSIVVEPRAASRGIVIGDRQFIGRLEVRAGKEAGLEIDALIALEDYVEGVVASETSIWSAPDAELEAQAVAARSYAVAALEQRSTKSREPYLFDDTRDQVFRGAWRAPRSPGAARVAERLHAAISRTRGQVLREGERVVDARFSAACGGATADARDVAPEADFACLRSVTCEPCEADATSARSWNFAADSKRLGAAARRLQVGDTLLSWRASKVDAQGRWLEVEVEGDRASKVVEFEVLRAAFEPDALRSNWITSVRAVEGAVRVEGRGRGHGVGLCQRGARGYAERGWTSTQILEHYFPGARVASVGG